jgi:hypothetical protein
MYSRSPSFRGAMARPASLAGASPVQQLYAALSRKAFRPISFGARPFTPGGACNRFMTEIHDGFGRSGIHPRILDPRSAAACGTDDPSNRRGTMHPGCCAERCGGAAVLSGNGKGGSSLATARFEPVRTPMFNGMPARKGPVFGNGPLLVGSRVHGGMFAYKREVGIEGSTVRGFQTGRRTTEWRISSK